MRTLVVGAGATGGFFGARLAQCCMAQPPATNAAPISASRWMLSPVKASGLAACAAGVVCTAAFCGTTSLITFDDQNPGMRGYTGQVTLKGYDNMTGLGTPAGQQFITALRALESGAAPGLLL